MTNKLMSITSLQLTFNGMNEPRRKGAGQRAE